MKRFDDYFLPYKKQYPSLVLTEMTKKKVMNFVSEVISAKNKEVTHQIDNQSEKKRWFTGMAGELAVERLIQTPFVDWTIGESKSYSHSDLRAIGLHVGVKTVEYGKFPVIFKKSSFKPEIIVVKEGDRFYVCGLATPEVLNTYQDDSLILDPKLRERNVKTGFYGFEHLIPFRSLQELTTILKQSKWKKAS